jgi:hypothetical protein
MSTREHLVAMSVRSASGLSRMTRAKAVTLQAIQTLSGRLETACSLDSEDSLANATDASQGDQTIGGGEGVQ